MSIKNLFPLDVEEVHTETDPNLVNGKLRQGWTLLLVYACLDGVGGSYGIYVLGKRRAPAAAPDDDFDQRRTYIP